MRSFLKDYYSFIVTKIKIEDERKRLETIKEEDEDDDNRSEIVST